MTRLLGWRPRWPRWSGVRRGSGGQSLGERGEDAAAHYLRRRRHRVVARRHKTRHGELDLVTLDGSTIVFVEVKTRSGSPPGESPVDAVDEAKQRQLTKAALAFLHSRDLLGKRCRFDVVAVQWPENHKGPASIEHFEDAFESTDGMSFY